MSKPKLSPPKPIKSGFLLKIIPRSPFYALARLSLILPMFNQKISTHYTVKKLTFQMKVNSFHFLKNLLIISSWDY